MYTEKDIYQIFRRVQSKVKNRPYKMPKDWEKHWETKFKSMQRETIRKMLRYSLTTWQDIDLYEYFSCGFELWKSFSYHQWFHTAVINLYIQKSKNRKRLEVNIKKILVESGKFVKQYCSENDIKSLKEYARIQDGFRLLCITHYLQDKISKWFLAFLIYKKYAPPFSRESWERIPEINENFDNIRRDLRDLGSFLDKLADCF